MFMSHSTRTGLQTKDAFGPGNGLSHQFGVAVRKEGVTAPMLKRVVDDPIHRGRVGALLKGETISLEVSLDRLAEREAIELQQLCTFAGLPYPGDSQIERALRARQAVAPLTEHDLVQVGGYTMEVGFDFFYAFNEQRRADGLDEFKLWQTPHREDWRSWRNAERFPTEFGVITVDFAAVLKSTNLLGHPFFLPQDKQEEWARAQGGDGLMSVEETLQLWARRLIQGKLPWDFGAARCRNALGSDFSLTVYWHANDGFRVRSWSREAYGPVAALARKYTGPGT